MKIDFYHIDAMESAHYVPLWQALRSAGADARLVAVPGRRNSASPGWFDFTRLKRYYEERDIPFATNPDYSSHAVTTQNCDLLGRYRGLHIRLMYGPVIYPDAWGLSERAIRPFDTILVHGPVYERLFSRWHSCEDLLIAGYPRFDDYYSGKIDISHYSQIWGLNPDLKTIVYLPTWGENSSLDQYLEAVSGLSGRFNVLLKPHHCTLRFEPEMMERVADSGLTVPDSAFDLPALYACADLVIADIRSAAFCEALVLGRPALGLVTDKADAEGWMAAERISELAEICYSPAGIADKVESALMSDTFASAREQWAAQHVAFRDGSGAESAAAGLIEYLYRRESELGGRTRGFVRQVRKLAGAVTGSVHPGPDTFSPYRTDYFNDFNRKLVEAARKGDYVFLIKHLVEQDSRYYDDFLDEKIENRTGLKIIFDEIGRLGRKCVVVDIACGNCSLLKRLAVDGHRVIGVDASPIRVMKNRPEVSELFFGMAEDLPVPDETADVVVATEALEHVFDAGCTVLEIARVLKPGGVVYCQVPEFDFADGENHLRHFSLESLSRLFRWGFVVESVRLIPYLDGERARNIFLVARKTRISAP